MRLSTTLASRFTMPGQVWSMAAWDPDGPLRVTSYGPSPDTTVLSAVDLPGEVRWRRHFSGTGRPRSRLAADGTVWVAYPDDDGRHILEGVRPDGSTHRIVRPEATDDTHDGAGIGAFVLLDDGFCISWAAGRASRGPGVRPRVVRYDTEGVPLWSTPVRLGALSHPKVVEMKADTGWEARPKKSWTPRSVQVAPWEPLLVSGDRIAAGFSDPSSGIGVTYFLDLASGGIAASTDPAPRSRAAIAGPGEFLVGAQGYGDFTTGRYDRAGREVARWASHGALLVDGRGGIRGPELENVLPSRSLFRQLAPGGALVDGPPLTGYYTTYPALDRDGTAVFWRDDKLLAVGADLTVHELYAGEGGSDVMSRVLLLADGRVVLALALGSDVLVFRTPLGPLADGPWPCGDANIFGNPVR